MKRPRIGTRIAESRKLTKVAWTRAIVFDLDDTLYPEREFALSGYEAVAGVFADRLGVSTAHLAARMGELFDTPLRRRVFNTILAEAGVVQADVDALVAEMIAVYRGHAPRIHLHPDADSALSRLRDRCCLGLISDGPLDTQRNKVRALGLTGRLEEIILTDEWGEEFWKPHPRPFEEMSRRLGLPPQACIYVADNPAKDFIAPNALGWGTVLIKRSGGIYADRQAPRGGVPQAAISTLEALSSP